jgi:hypothetical protein
MKLRRPRACRETRGAAGRGTGGVVLGAATREDVVGGKKGRGRAD